MSERHIAPYGSWVSPFPIDWLTSGVVTYGGLRADGDALTWLEGRPEDDGRVRLVRRAPDGMIEELGPPGVNVRSRVHEYGGGPYLAVGDVVVVSDFATGRLLHRLADGSWEPLTPDRAWRFADISLDVARGRLLAVREDHEPETLARHGEAENAIVSISLESGEVDELASGRDFYAAPRLSAEGSRMAWLEWDHPNMPWDGTELYVADLDGDGWFQPAERIAGDESTWVAQPRWDPDGSLWFAAEPGEWPRLHRWRAGDEPVAMTEDGIEFAFPDWVFGLANHQPLGDGRSVAIGRSDGRDRLYLVGPGAGQVAEVPLPYTELSSVAVVDDGVVILAAAPTEATAIVEVALPSGDARVVRPSLSVTIDPTEVSVGQPISFPSTDGRIAYGIFYAPHNSAYHGQPGELPPLIVTSHGGPTAQAYTGLSLTAQAFTSRGIAILDVDYGGSTGYGRAYRRSLEGEWGIVDVDDCVAGAVWLAEQGLVDGGRLTVRGGSASGFTTLAALAFRDTFDAGISYFGIGDLEAFTRETHKFESRYLDRLIGPLPEARELYEARSPNFHAEGISAPVLILQGAEDRIVPPAEAERIAGALAGNGIPHALLIFPGEDHGFRQESSLRQAFEAELSFLGQVFGFVAADDIQPVQLVTT